MSVADRCVQSPSFGNSTANSSGEHSLYSTVSRPKRVIHEVVVWHGIKLRLKCLKQCYTKMYCKLQSWLQLFVIYPMSWLFESSVLLFSSNAAFVFENILYLFVVGLDLVDSFNYVWDCSAIELLFCVACDHS